MCLPRNRLCQQSLTGSGRADEQAALRKLCADLGVLVRMLQELDCLLQGFLRLILSGDVLKRHAGFRLHVHLCAALADAHHAARAGHSAHHDTHQDPDQDQWREAQDHVQDQACRIIRNLLLELHVRLIQPVHDVGILDTACVVGHLDPLARQALILRYDSKLIRVELNGFYKVLFKQIQKLVIGDLHRSGVIHHPVKKAHQHQGDQSHHQEDQDRRMVAVLVVLTVPAAIPMIVFIHLYCLLFLISYLSSRGNTGSH